MGAGGKVGLVPTTGRVGFTGLVGLTVGFFVGLTAAVGYTAGVGEGTGVGGYLMPKSSSSSFLKRFIMNSKILLKNPLSSATCVLLSEAVEEYSTGQGASESVGVGTYGVGDAVTGGGGETYAAVGVGDGFI